MLHSPSALGVRCRSFAVIVFAVAVFPCQVRVSHPEYSAIFRPVCVLVPSTHVCVCVCACVRVRAGVSGPLGSGKGHVYFQCSAVDPTSGLGTTTLCIMALPTKVGDKATYVNPAVEPMSYGFAGMKFVTFSSSSLSE